jgi:hypothetical protein
MVTPLFDLGVDFGVFDPKIWEFRVRVLVNLVNMLQSISVWKPI